MASTFLRPDLSLVRKERAIEQLLRIYKQAYGFNPRLQYGNSTGRSSVTLGTSRMGFRVKS